MVIVVRALLIGLGPVLRTFILWGLRIGAGATAIWFLTKLSETTSGVPLIGRISGLLNRAALSVQHYVNANTAAQALDTQGPTIGFVSGLAGVLEGQAEAQYTVATHTFTAVETLTHVTIPRMIEAGAGDAVATSRVAGNAARAAQVRANSTAGRLGRAVTTVEGLAATALVVAERAYHKAVAVTHPGALPWVGREVNEAKALSERVARNLKDVRNLLAAGVFAGLVARALTRLGTGNIRCGNLKNVERQLCGAPPGLLDDLLAGLTLIVGTVSLIEFARACQTIEGEVVSGVKSFVRT